jgi:hypothetical protein
MFQAISELKTFFFCLTLVLYKKQNLTGYIQCYKKNGGTDTKPMGQTEPQFLSDPMSDRKKKFSILKWPGTLQGQIYW